MASLKSIFRSYDVLWADCCWIALLASLFLAACFYAKEIDQKSVSSARFSILQLSPALSITPMRFPTPNDAIWLGSLLAVAGSQDEGKRMDLCVG